MIHPTHNKKSSRHENDSPQKEILTYSEPESLDWVMGEIGSPPLDVSGVTYLLFGMESLKKRYQLESTRRTLEAMVKDGLLEKVVSYEQRQDTKQSGDGKGIAPVMACLVARYYYEILVENVKLSKVGLSEWNSQFYSTQQGDQY